LFELAEEVVHQLQFVGFPPSLIGLDDDTANASVITLHTLFRRECTLVLQFRRLALLHGCAFSLFGGNHRSPDSMKQLRIVPNFENFLLDAGDAQFDIDEQRSKGVALLDCRWQLFQFAIEPLDSRCGSIGFVAGRGEGNEGILIEPDIGERC
jgi:hypothetical protein